MTAGGSEPGRGRAQRWLGWPLRRALDPRVRWGANLVGDHVDARAEGLERRLDELEDRLGRLLDARSRATLGSLGRLHADLHGGRPEALSDLGADVAQFLNWTSGPDGYAAQARLWFNTPVPVEHHAGRVEPLLVNERIVEQPFVFGALSGLEPPARVLDVGGAESTVALALAALGHRVTVVDPRGYRLSHPGLRALACRLEELDQEETGFDAAVALSAIEHFGLNHYTEAPAEREAPRGREDLEAVRELARRVRPGGLLVLTVPLGEPAVDDFERVYDLEGVRDLLGGWQVLRLAAAWRRDQLTWVAGPADAPAGERGVALVLAANPETAPDEQAAA